VHIFAYLHPPTQVPIANAPRDLWGYWTKVH